MNEEQALRSMKGKTIKSIQHHNLVGIIEFHFTDGCSIQVYALEKGNQHVTIIEPKKK